MPFARVSGTRVWQTRKLTPPSYLAIRRWRRAVVLLVSLAAIEAGGCAKTPGSSPGITVEHEITPQPARVGPATITLKLTDAAAKSITGARIALEADMSHAGMSPVFGEAKEIEPGRYQGRMDFTMAGDWVILLRITLSDGQVLERQLDVKGVRAS